MYSCMYRHAACEMRSRKGLTGLKPRWFLREPPAADGIEFMRRYAHISSSIDTGASAKKEKATSVL